jgi:hypothetical protein
LHAIIQAGALYNEAQIRGEYAGASPCFPEFEPDWGMRLHVPLQVIAGSLPRHSRMAFPVLKERARDDRAETGWNIASRAGKDQGLIGTYAPRPHARFNGRAI